MLELEGYEVVKEIGRGRRATLYAGTRKADGISVILKEFIIPADAGDDFRDKYVTRYLGECGWLKDITHKNVIDVLEIIPPDSARATPVMVMEALGTSLQHTYLTNSSLRGEDVVGWMVQILNGLREFHQNQIIHRDIKPANIMLNGAGVPKIIDLSIAVKMGHEITLTPEDISTQYAAPEMYKGRSGANFSTDIYSLGIMFYQLLCGKDLFEQQFEDILTDNEQENLLRWMYWHCDHDIALSPLIDVLPTVPEYLSDIIGKMTAKTLGERYQAVDEVLADLKMRSAEEDADSPFTLVIQEHIGADYWKESQSYVPVKKEEPVEIKPVVAKGDDAAARRKKQLLMIAVAAVWSLMLSGGAVWYFLNSGVPKEVSDAAFGYVERARLAYAESRYEDAHGIVEEGLRYIEASGEAEGLQDHSGFLKHLGEDVVWIVDLAGQFQEANEAVDARDLDAATTVLTSLQGQGYVRGTRRQSLHELTEAKFGAIRTPVDELSAALPTIAQIFTAEDEGKLRKAHHVTVTSEISDWVRSGQLGRIQPTIDSLDQARAAIASKEFAAAMTALSSIERNAAQPVVEAAYLASVLEVGPIHSLEPLVRVGAQWGTIERNGLEWSIVQAMSQMADLRIRKYALDHRELEPDDTSLSVIEPGMNAKLRAEGAELRQSSDAIMDRLSTLINDGGDSADSDTPLPAECKYPIEDSKEYYLARFSDLLLLRMEIALDEKNEDDANLLYDMLPPSFPEEQKRYLLSRLYEQGQRDGTPEKAMDLYEELLNDYPRWAECRFRMGQVAYHDLNDFERGINMIGAAVELQPATERYRWWGARMAVDYSAALGKARKWGEAERMTDLSLEFWPDFPSAHFTRAMNSYNQKNEDDARGHFREFERAFEERKYRYASDDQYLLMMSRVKEELGLTE